MCNILQDRYPSRSIISDGYCRRDVFYYFSREKQVRMVKADGSVWTTDHDRGPPWFKQIRKGPSKHS